MLHAYGTACARSTGFSIVSAAGPCSQMSCLRIGKMNSGCRLIKRK